MTRWRKYAMRKEPLTETLALFSLHPPLPLPAKPSRRRQPERLSRPLELCCVLRPRISILSVLERCKSSAVTVQQKQAQDFLSAPQLVAFGCCSSPYIRGVSMSRT